MPNTRSAAKQLRSSERKRLRNRSVKSTIHTRERTFHEALAAGDVSRAEEALRVLSADLDRAANRGVIHPNKADRKKSRSHRRLVAAQTAGSD
jgi:small subunit ribosomal protein S20